MIDKITAIDNLLDVAFGIRDYLCSCIESWQVDTKNVLVITALAKKQDRKQLTKRLRVK
mgnify:CR=1 FL=1